MNDGHRFRWSLCPSLLEAVESHSVHNFCLCLLPLIYTSWNTKLLWDPRGTQGRSWFKRSSIIRVLFTVQQQLLAPVTKEFSVTRDSCEQQPAATSVSPVDRTCHLKVKANNLNGEVPYRYKRFILLASIHSTSPLPYGLRYCQQKLPRTASRTR